MTLLTTNYGRRLSVFVERFNGTVLDEFFRPAMHQKLFESVEALQADLDAWLAHYNRERPHLGYRNQGRRPWETIDGFVRQGGYYSPTNMPDTSYRYVYDFA